MQNIGVETKNIKEKKIGLKVLAVKKKKITTK